MLKKAVVLSCFILVTVMVQAEVKPLWDLAKDQIQANLRSGKIEKKDGLVILKDGAAFAVPASAFPDQNNFTVEVVASLQKLIDHAAWFPAELGAGSPENGTQRLAQSTYLRRFNINWLQ